MAGHYHPKCRTAPTDTWAVAPHNRTGGLEGRGLDDRVTNECCVESACERASQGCGEPVSSPLLTPGRNCWRIERADKVSLLVDGEEYFGAVRRRSPVRSIRSTSWAGTSTAACASCRTERTMGCRSRSANFSNAVVARRRALRGYVLSWDFAMLYAMEREWLPIYKLDGRTHRRLKFRLDDQHPVGASHHQKVIVVDDAVAFVSGYDLTRCRWDTQRSSDATIRDASITAASAIRRSTTSGSPSPAIARVHWATSRASAGCAPPVSVMRRPRRRTLRTYGRAGIAVAATDVDVAIARTEPAFAGRPAVTEIRQLHLDAIAAAPAPHLRREPVFHVARDRARVCAAPRRGRSAGDRGAVALHAKRLARDFDDGRAARTHSPDAS